MQNFEPVIDHYSPRVSLLIYLAGVLACWTVIYWAWHGIFE